MRSPAANAAGALYATDYTLAHAERVTSLALISSTLGIVDPDYVAMGERIRPPAFFQLPHEVQELGPGAARQRGGDRGLGR